MFIGFVNHFPSFSSFSLIFMIFIMYHHLHHFRHFPSVSMKSFIFISVPSFSIIFRILSPLFIMLFVIMSIFLNHLYGCHDFPSCSSCFHRLLSLYIILIGSHCCPSFFIIFIMCQQFSRVVTNLFLLILIVFLILRCYCFVESFVLIQTTNSTKINGVVFC